VSRATCLARSTVGRELGELRAGEELEGEHVRRPCGGRKPLSETDASLIDDLRCLVEPITRGDPRSPLLWTCKSLRKLSQGLREMAHNRPHPGGQTAPRGVSQNWDFQIASGQIQFS
jgi:hypothetical protein